MMFFEKNDIVRLRKEYFDEVKSELFFSQNIFFMDKYSEDKKTAFLRNVNIPIPSDEICPVRIDGIEDRDVYYDPVIAADVVRPGESLPCHHVNKDEYYLQELKKYSVSAKGWVESLGFKYLSATSKEEVDTTIKELCNVDLDKPILLEVFTTINTDINSIKEYFASLDRRTFSEKLISTVVGKVLLSSVKQEIKKIIKR